MENKKEAAKIICKYSDPNAFVMTCESEEPKQKVAEPQVVEQPEPVVEQPVAEPVLEQVDTEEIAVPVVGDAEETDDSYVEPLGETASWYPENAQHDNLINYSYGKSTEFVASLTNPEVGFEASDILLVAIIALSCLAVVGSITFLTGKAINNRARRKDFIKK